MMAHIDDAKQYSRMKVIKKFLKLIFSMFPIEVLAIVIFNIISGLIPAFTTYIWKLIFERVYELSQKQVKISILYFVIGLFIILQIIKHVLVLINEIYLNMIKEKIKIHMLSYIHETVSDIPLECYENSDFYNSISRAYDVLNSHRFMRLITGIVQIFQNIISTVSVAIVLSTFNPWLILLCFVSIIPPSVGRIIKGNRFYYLKVYQTPKWRFLRYYTKLLTSKNSIKEFRVFGATSYIEKLWRSIKKEIHQNEWEFTKKQGLTYLLLDLTRILGFGLGIVVCALMLVKGQLGVGAFGAAISAIKNVQNSFSNVLISSGYVETDILEIRDLIKLFDMKPVKYGDFKFTMLQQKITLQNIIFSYPGSKEIVLKNINLEIKKGQSVAILGVNGAGKSTLAKLILGIYAPTKGVIMYDGVKLADCQPETLYNNISVVFQDYVRYLMTLRENIGFGDLSKLYNDKALINCAVQYDLEDMIKKMPNGLDSVIGREFYGEELSGGEWQKVAIARGSIKNSDIIILDEPTASIDPIMEAEIFRQFLCLSKGKTSIIISHRVGSARLADRILVMKDGKIVEDGTHEFLIKQNGEYQKLYTIQANWYK